MELGSSGGAENGNRRIKCTEQRLVNARLCPVAGCAIGATEQQRASQNPNPTLARELRVDDPWQRDGTSKTHSTVYAGVRYCPEASHSPIHSTTRTATAKPNGIRRAKNGPGGRQARWRQRVSFHSSIYSSMLSSVRRADWMRPINNSSFVTPLNLLLLGVFLYTAYTFFKPSAPATLPKEEAPIVFTTYTPRTLLPFNGENGAPVFLAVRGRVFDVSKGRNFYGPGGPYENFAGRDASRGLAKGSFDEDMLTKDLDGPLDTLADLTKEDFEALQGWEERFLEKYLVVGKLVPVGQE
ncbi:cytochrome b5-like heme/steroid binding domain-containing protein [Bombardia bombarda]|uniref:Cytochrome b5-like heme/steroid binding domain-containing protein n=1 Tax=Bombardia bombarda TaxID=252184 RepID=A0AA39XM80_9PEZI|nr:cytochrome b5-like heme/steroid binding domain-containing protein [Bombardia bombarda]